MSSETPSRVVSIVQSLLQSVRTLFPDNSVEIFTKSEVKRVIRRVHSFAQKLWIIRNTDPLDGTKQLKRNTILSPLLIESIVWDFALFLVNEDSQAIIESLYGKRKKVVIPEPLPLTLPTPSAGIQIVKYLFYNKGIIMALGPPDLRKFEEKFGKNLQVIDSRRGYIRIQTQIAMTTMKAFPNRHYKKFNHLLEKEINKFEVPKDWNLIYVSAISLTIEFPNSGLPEKDKYGEFRVTPKSNPVSVRKVTFTRKVKYVEGTLQLAFNDPSLGANTSGQRGYKAVGIDITIGGNDLVLMIIYPTANYQPDEIPLTHLERIIAQFYPGEHKCPKANLFPNILEKATEKLMKISLPVFSMYDKFSKLKEAFQIMGITPPFVSANKKFTKLFSMLGEEYEKSYCVDSIFHAAHLRIKESNGEDNCFNEPTAPSESNIETLNISRPFFFAVIYQQTQILFHGAIHYVNFLELEKKPKTTPGVDKPGVKKSGVNKPGAEKSSAEKSSAEKSGAEISDDEAEGFESPSTVNFDDAATTITDVQLESIASSSEASSIGKSSPESVSESSTASTTRLLRDSRVRDRGENTNIIRRFSSRVRNTLRSPTRSRSHSEPGTSTDSKLKKSKKK